MEYNWFISVKKAYKTQFVIELNEEILKNTNVSVVAQKLLNNGNLKGIKDLFDISIGALKAEKDIVEKYKETFI